MELQKQPNDWSCLLTAFSMALHIPIERLIDMIGHDGSERIWPDFPEPQCYRSFHPQELIDCALLMNCAVTAIEMEPCCMTAMDNNELLFHDLGSALEIYDAGDAYKLYQQIVDNHSQVYKLKIINHQQPHQRLINYMNRFDGVLVGRGRSGRPHAAAWCHLEKQVFDPNGTKYKATRFFTEVFFALTPIRPGVTPG